MPVYITQYIKRGGCVHVFTRFAPHFCLLRWFLRPQDVPRSPKCISREVSSSLTKSEKNCQKIFLGEENSPPFVKTYCGKMAIFGPLAYSVFTSVLGQFWLWKWFLSPQDVPRVPTCIFRELSSSLTKSGIFVKNWTFLTNICLHFVPHWSVLKFLRGK